jgi:hypothetical protein
MPRRYSSDDGGYSSESSDESSDDSHSHSRRYKRKRNNKRHKQNHGNSHKRRSQAGAHSQQAGVYVIRNTDTNVCYVGKSENIPVRINQHKQENRNISREGTITHGSVDDLESWERNEVLTRMYQTGMESVRGWRYTRKGPLTMDENISARNDIMEKFDLCRRCGHNNHFANKCFARSPAFWCNDIPMQ